MRVLGEVCEDRKNGFNFLRLLAATGILVAHCMLAVPVVSGHSGYLFAEFSLAADLLLAVFFVFSGFLIAASLERNTDLLRFALARLLRIYPALIGASLMTFLLLGPVVTSLSLADYFSTGEAWLYLPRMIFMLDAKATLPGVFDTHPVAHAVNLPIWTLRFEVVIYAVFPILALYFINRRQVVKMAALFTGGAVLVGLKYVFHPQIMDTGLIHLTNFATSFLIGCSIWTFRNRIPNHILMVLFLWLMFAVSYGLFINYFIGVIAAGYTFIWVAFAQCSPLNAYGKVGDYSYGIYVMHFPVAQAIYGIYPQMAPISLAVVTLATTLPLALISWHVVEKPALSQVKNLTNWFNAVFHDWLHPTRRSLSQLVNGH